MEISGKNLHHLIFFSYLCPVAKNQINDQLTRNEEQGPLPRGPFLLKKQANLC